MRLYKFSILSIVLILCFCISHGQQKTNLSSDGQTYLLQEYRTEEPLLTDNITYVDSVLQAFFKVSLKEYCWQFLNQNLSYTVDFENMDTIRFDSFIKEEIKSADPKIQTKPTIVNILMNTSLILHLDGEEKEYFTSISLDKEQIFRDNRDYQALLLHLSTMNPLLGFEIIVAKNPNNAHLYFFSKKAK